MEEDLPYRAEYAKSGRASCKGCKSQIEKAALRIAAMVQSAFHDGKQPNWFHSDCFFAKHRPAAEGDIAQFANLRYEDQKKIRDGIANLGSGVVMAGTAGKGKGKRAKEASGAVKDFGIEYAKSNRSTCKGCEIKINKDEIRIKKISFDTEVGMKYGGQPLWHHVECFAQLRNDLGWFETGAALPGFNTLKKPDQDTVKKAIPAIKAEDVPATKKLKTEPKDDIDAAEQEKLEKKIETQTKKIFKFRDQLATWPSKDMKQLLEANGMQAPNDSSVLLDHLADCLTFGGIKRCSKCPDGQYYFTNSGYLCNGNLTEWVKCLNLVKEPERFIFKVPDEFKDEYPFLAKYKGKIETRALKYVPPSAKALEMTGNLKKEDALDGPKVKREKPPLYNFQFVCVGLGDVTELKARIEKLGGRVAPRVTTTTMAVVSTEKEVKRMSSKIVQAKEYGIHVVPVEYFDDVEADKTGAVSFISKTSLCDWGVDPNTRLPQEEEKSSKSKSLYTKSVPKSMKLTVKSGSAIDPASGLQDFAHVYVDKCNNKYNAVLGLTDIQSKTNKYYKLQLLQSDKGNNYWVFRSWGRIGTTIGGTKLDTCSSLSEAQLLFDSLYLEKTGNRFNDRQNFVKRPGLMYPIDIDYGGDDDNVKLNTEHKVKSKLPTPVQNLIKLIFDVDAMKRVMKEFDLDMEKMPLGKLSQKQIQSAYKVLTEISELIQNGGSNVNFIECTNRFYTLIPHSFGVNNPPILDTVEQVKNLSEMLDNLMEIECAYSMLKTEDAAPSEDVNPIDKHYEQLKTEMIPIDKKSDEFKTIKKYVQNTHADTHKNYELEIIDIFKVARKGEARRFKPFKKLHNRKLLWHGSRLTNFVGILSHGLKIAPPEAPATGYMFGKGIYFADMVSKSANYCFTSSLNRDGLMLLSEVALGDMHECRHAEYVTKLPPGKHSTKGIGRTQPNPAESIVREDGVEIPLGKPLTDPNTQASLLYNEFIVYDIAQVNIQYLLRMNFKYNY